MNKAMILEYVVPKKYTMFKNIIRQGHPNMMKQWSSKK